MSTLGRAGLAAIAVSIAGTVAVGAAGTSLMAPPLPGAPGWLPWGLDLRLSPYFAVGLAAVSLAAGALGLLLTLRAMRSGWTVSPRSVLLAGAGAAIAVGTTRPFGTSDFLSYAAYGHELVTGHNPYLVAPRALPGDPVARAVQDWAGTPSVYGALATGVFGAAALVGGLSARLTVFALDLVSAAAFVVTGVLLYRLARGPDAGPPGAPGCGQRCCGPAIRCCCRCWWRAAMSTGWPSRSASAVSRCSSPSSRTGPWLPPGPCAAPPPGPCSAWASR